MADPVDDFLTPDHISSCADLIEALVSDPCIARHDSKKRNYLLIDFSGMGFGYEIAQPSNDPDSLAAMHWEII